LSTTRRSANCTARVNQKIRDSSRRTRSTETSGSEEARARNLAGIKRAEVERGALVLDRTEA